MHQNEVFSFFKIIFDINTSKRSENIKKNYFKQKTISKFLGTQFAPHSQTLSSSIDVICGNLIKKKSLIALPEVVY